MGLTKFLLLGLAAAGSALGQNDICSKSTITIKSPDDASALSSCNTIEGDIQIDKSATGTLRFSGVQNIKGSFLCDGAKGLSEIYADDLRSIGNRLLLHGLTILQTLSFSQLTSVKTFDAVTLPQLTQFSFGQQIQTGDNVRISDTKLTSLDGINLMEVARFDVNNNGNLNEVNLQLTNVTEYLNIQANARGVKVSFPDLQDAKNLSFRQCGDVNVPSLERVRGNVGFIDNAFSTFSAPNLTRVDQDLTFVANDDLKNVSIPSLTRIDGGFAIANNTKLHKINGFQDLKSVGGAIVFRGTFDEVDLPKLERVDGGTVILSTGDISCKKFDDLHSSGGIEGRYKCSGHQDSATATSTGQPGDTSKTNAAVPFSVPVSNSAVGFASILAAILGLTL